MATTAELFIWEGEEYIYLIMKQQSLVKVGLSSIYREEIESTPLDAGHVDSFDIVRCLLVGIDQSFPRWVGI